MFGANLLMENAMNLRMNGVESGKVLEKFGFGLWFGVN